MILDEIVANKKLQLVEDKKALSLEDIKAKLDFCKYEKRNFKEALKKERISIISEIKKASPSKGIIREDFNPEKIGEIYEKIDIDAISILTEKNISWEKTSILKK